MGDASQFIARMEELREQVGHEQVKGTVEFDQVYAFNQHEQHWDNFLGRYGFKEIEVYHRGGGSHFLSRPLFAGAADFMQKLADHVLLPGGPAEGMIEAVEELADEAAAEAPLEFGDLKESAHPTAYKDGAVVYDRPAIVGRLDDDSLARKGAKKAGDLVRDYLPVGHPRHGTTHEDPAEKPAPTRP